MHFSTGVKIIGLVIVCLILVLLFAVKFTSSGFFCRYYTENMVRDFTYPVARRDESVVDDFHGTKVRVSNTEVEYSNEGKIQCVQEKLVSVELI